VADDSTTGDGPATAEGEPTDRPNTPIGLLAAWLGTSLHRDPTVEQREAVEGLIPTGDEFRPYLVQFGALTVLSASIAAFGLLADSAGVVIGAMLVAPLMTPIIAAAAATVTARNDRLVRAVLVLAFGMAVAIAVGWLIAFVAAPDVVGTSDLPNEVRNRTFPQLLDLGIAITAGAAAGYITPRSSALGALPGVGIAVALVPPLTVVGITAQAGLPDQAGNALLLFLTNLAAIVFAAALMLLLGGFRPHREADRRSLPYRLLLTVVAVALVAVPLTLHTQATLRDLRLQRAVADAVADWDDGVRVIDISADVAGGLADVEVVLAGSGEPRPAWQLAEGIRDRFGGPVDLRLLYERDQIFVVSTR
jgi:uncharacterized hydrophobic protein (TIGR00271 family)